MPQVDELDANSALVFRQRANYVSFNNITADYTLVIGDWGKWLRANSSSDIIITVPPNSSVSLPVGAAIPIVRRGTGEVSFSPGSGVTLNSDGEDTLIPAQFKTVLLVQDAANEWLLQGIGATGSSSGGGGDVTAPTVVSATATDANTIVVVFSESVTATTAGWSFNNGGALTINGVSGAGTTWSFDINEDMADSDTITRTYNSGTGNTVDGSSNELASFTGSSVTNDIDVTYTPSLQNFDGVTPPAIPASLTADSNIITAAEAGTISPPNLITTNSTAYGWVYKTSVIPSANTYVSLYTVVAVDTGNTILYLRSSNTKTSAGGNNAYIFDFYMGPAFGNLNLYKQVGGSLTALGTLNASVATGIVYKLTLTANGTAISAKVQRNSDGYYLNSSGVFVNSVQTAISATNGDVTAAGYSGFYMGGFNGLSQGWVDDLTI